MTAFVATKMIVSNNWVRLPEVDPLVRQVLDAELRYATVQGRMGVRDPESSWDGWVRFLTKRASGEHVFPTGLLPRVIRLLRRMDLPYALEETRERPPLGQPVGERIPLYDYQDQAVKAALDAGRGVIDSPPRSGKTRCVAELVRRIGLPAIWVAPTSQIVQQTVDTLQAFFPPGTVVGLVGSAKAQAAQDALVVVCTTATAAALTSEFFAHLQVMIWDEWHHAGAKTYRALFRLCEHIYYRYGMTGTHYRSGEDGMSMEALLGNVVFKISSAELVARGRLVPLDVLFLQTHFERVRADPSDFIGGFGKAGAFEHVGRNQLVARTAAYLLERGRKVLVLVRTRIQGRMVAEMVAALVPANPPGCRLAPVEFVSAQAKRSRIKEVIGAFVGSSEVRCLVGTSLIGEGTDLPMADALVYAAAGSAQVSLMQNAYRVCTQVDGKPARALLVDFSDRHHHKLLAQSIARLQVYSQESTFAPHYVESPRHLAEWLARQAG